MMDFKKIGSHNFYYYAYSDGLYYIEVGQKSPLDIYEVKIYYAENSFGQSRSMFVSVEFDTMQIALDNAPKVYARFLRDKVKEHSLEIGKLSGSALGGIGKF